MYRGHFIVKALSFSEGPRLVAISCVRWWIPEATPVYDGVEEMTHPLWICRLCKEKEDSKYHNDTFFFFGHVACGILVPWWGTEPRPSAARALSANHWTSGEFPTVTLSRGSSAPSECIHRSASLQETKVPKNTKTKNSLSCIGNVWWVTEKTWYFWRARSQFCLPQHASGIQPLSVSARGFLKQGF